MPVLTGSVHARILTKPSRAGFDVVRLELIEPGAATCVQRHGWAVFKKLGTYVPGNVSVYNYSGIMYGCVRYVLRVDRVDSGWGVQTLFVVTLLGVFLL